jgi:hypothetical protein
MDFLQTALVNLILEDKMRRKPRFFASCTGSGKVHFEMKCEANKKKDPTGTSGSREGLFS